MAKKTEYQNINVCIKNKSKLEEIRHELERFHKKDFRTDVAISHVLKVYGNIMKILKNKEDQKKYDKYLQML